ncbi:MAG: T9SS type A sorting domain-containing protein [Bacteroidota bacterium]
MKKFYLFSIFLFSLVSTIDAQLIEDDFEFYVPGDMGEQNPTVWSTWSGDPSDGSNILVVEGVSTGSGNQAGFIGPGSLQDCLLLLGNQTFGNYFISFNMYIPTGKTAYFNIQGETETNTTTGYEGAGNGGLGVFNSGNLFFNNGGVNPGIFEDDATGDTATYPEETWFPVEIYVDVDELTYEITIDGTLVHAPLPGPFLEDPSLGGIDFFSIDNNNEYYIDDVLVIEGVIIGREDHQPIDFTVYPNPVTDILYINTTSLIHSIKAYDAMGNLILTTQVDTINPALDMSHLSSGIYVIEVSSNRISRTFKVIK